MISNHESEADIFLSCLLPWNLKYLAKAEIYGTPIMGWGMKMAGDMGTERVTQRGLHVADVDTERNLLMVRGAVPGPIGGVVEIRSDR